MSHDHDIPELAVQPQNVIDILNRCLPSVSFPFRIAIGGFTTQSDEISEEWADMFSGEGDDGASYSQAMADDLGDFFAETQGFLDEFNVI